MPQRGHRAHPAGPDRGHAARPRGRQPARAPGLARADDRRLARLRDGRDHALPAGLGRLPRRRPSAAASRRARRSAASRERTTTTGRCSTTRFLRRGAYVIPAGAHDWSESGPTFTPPVEPTPDDPNAWHPEDVLLVPLNATNGSLLGVMSVDEPASLRRPDDDELDVLVAVGRARRACDRGRPGRRDGVAPRGVAQAPLARLVAAARVRGRERDPPGGRRQHPSRARLRARVDRAHASGRQRVQAALVHGLGLGGPAADRADARDARAAARRRVRDRGLLPPAVRSRAAARDAHPLRVGAERPRPARVEPALAGRAADGSGGHAAGLHLGGRPGRPARAAAREDAGAAAVRQPGVRGARVGGALRGAAVPRRPRSAHAAAEPPRVRAPARHRDLARAALRPPVLARALRPRRVQGAQRPRGPSRRRRGARPLRGAPDRRDAPHRLRLPHRRRRVRADPRARRRRRGEGRDRADPRRARTPTSR